VANQYDMKDDVVTLTRISGIVPETLEHPLVSRFTDDGVYEY